ncbi:MAG: ornithine cyclodeaminase family protein [Candidatus Saccharicenans sp.]|jgi:ornithine cyclodeaminase|nr:ornithine cyclodeaminase family protein [Candidatus Saccharicenans sp.]MDH7492797.1 ornithine cyclodeaminase family protein [Candidatus Saccharicenans sp.]
MDARLYLEPEIKRLVNLRAAIAPVESSLAAYSSGRAILPGVINLDLPEFQGEVHVKGAYIKAEEYYVIKVASGFYQNPGLGLPVGNGLMLVFRAKTGELAAILLDNGYLTELRTAAAGAVAAKYLARNPIEKVAVIGSGFQARFQLRALAEVRNFKKVAVWSRNPENIKKYIVEMSALFPEVVFLAANSPEGAVREADLMITATPSRQPIVRAEWLKPGVHITAMGSDGPEKEELYPEVLARADRVFCDSIAQCRRLGEVHHALEAGVISEDDISGEIGELVLGQKPGRQAEEEITVADLTGLGIQDVAIAGLFLRLAEEAGLPGHILDY